MIKSTIVPLDTVAHDASQTVVDTTTKAVNALGHLFDVPGKIVQGVADISNVPDVPRLPHAQEAHNNLRSLDTNHSAHYHIPQHGRGNIEVSCFAVSWRGRILSPLYGIALVRLAQ